jgi:serine/threonine protein kinase
MLGCIAYTLCFAKHPFMDQSALAILNASFTLPPASHIGDKLRDLIRFLLVPDPNERPNICNVLTVLDNWEQCQINLPPSALIIK